MSSPADALLRETADTCARRQSAGAAVDGWLRVADTLVARPPAADCAMSRAGSLGTRLRAAEAALDVLPVAVFVLDPDATLRHANAAAHRLLVAGDGLSIQLGRLTAGINGDAARLRATIRAAAEPRVTGARRALPSALPIRRSAGLPPLCATARPLNSASEGPASLVLLFVVDPAAPRIASLGVLREAFGLTEQEIRVALAALRLGGLPEAAASLGIALTTARSHLQHVFDKTGTRNQVALAQMVVALGALPATEAVGGRELAI
jgi:DNA-binding CsgD family transcriptional regulator